MSSVRYLRAYFPSPSGGSSFSGTPGVASKVLTGQVPVLTISFKFTPAVASLVKTGQVPTLLISGPFIGVPGVASKVLTGYTPILTISGGGGWDYKSKKKKKRVIIGAKAYEVANADELNYILARELASDAPISVEVKGKTHRVALPSVISLGPINPVNVEILTEQATRLHQVDVLQALLDVQAIAGAHRAILADDADIEHLLLSQHVHIPFEALASLMQALIPARKAKIMPKAKPEPVKLATKAEHESLKSSAADLSEQLTALSKQINERHDALSKALSAPLNVERGPDGRVIRLVQKE